MKRTRKGFTLVELLIVIAVLGSLSAAMTMSSSSATAKAKAAAIANNLKICTSGAHVYNFEHSDESTLKDVTTRTMLEEAVTNFADFTVTEGDNDTIAYASADVANKTAPAKWSVTVTLKGTDKSEVVKALKKLKGFKGLTDAGENDYTITYEVFAGKATGPTS